MQMIKPTTSTVAAFAMAISYCLNAHAQCNGPSNLPSEQLHVVFKVNEAKIAAGERRRLDQWISAMNSGYAIQQWVTVIGSAAQTEANPNALAMKRAVAVAADALAAGLTRAPMQVKAQVYPVENRGPTNAEFREVTLQVSPGCPDDCCVGHQDAPAQSAGE